MRVLVTGSEGYIGTVLVPRLLEAGHEVVGLDVALYEGCTFGGQLQQAPTMRMDVRDVEVADLIGFDAVMHLAAICNDPLGKLNPEVTYSVNHLASVRLAIQAKRAGVGRFLFSSSCFLYGAADGNSFKDEQASFNPLTPYRHSKALAEQDIAQLADDDFSPTFLRSASAYGVSPRLRGDLVVNNLVGLAFTIGAVHLLSDGTPWRPLVHVEDISTAFLAILEAPRELVHGQAFNIGRTAENYRVSELAEMVRRVVPDSQVSFAAGAGPDKRCYRVDCAKLATTLPGLQMRWTVRRGIEQLYQAFRQHGLTLDDLTGSRYQRIAHLRSLIDDDRLDEDLRWRQYVRRSPSASRRALTGQQQRS